MKNLVTSCLLCGGVKLVRTPYPKKGSEKADITFENVAVCQDCGFGRAEPVLSQKQLDEFYEKGLYWEKPVHLPTLLAHQKVQAQYRVKKCINFLRSKTGVSVLDIGAGQGHILEWLAHYFGFDKLKYDFIEPDPTLSKKIVDSGLVKNVNKISVMALRPNQYDVIFLNHVIEHVEDPIEFLSLILKSLKHDGVCYIETPCRDDLLKEDVFPHTLFFTPESYKKLAEKLSVKISDVRTFGSKISICPTEQRKFINKVIFRLFHISANKNIWPLISRLDSLIFQYAKPADGIWVSAFFRK